MMTTPTLTSPMTLLSQAIQFFEQYNDEIGIDTNGNYSQGMQCLEILQEQIRAEQSHQAQ